jgi:hypothetical protein
VLLGQWHGPQDSGDSAESRGISAGAIKPAAGSDHCSEPDDPYRVSRSSPGSGRGERGVLAAAATGESPQQAQFAIKQCTRVGALDLPTPRVCQIESSADLPGAAVRHGPESPWIAPVAALPFSKVEHDAARRALHLIGRLGAVLPELRDHGTKGTNQIQRDVIGNQHDVFSSVFISEGERPRPTTFLGWAPPVATDPRQAP